MTVNFLIDKNYLLVHTLSGKDKFSSDDHKEDVVAFQNLAWRKSEKNYNLLINGTSWEKTEKYLMTLIKSAAFKFLLKQTQDYLIFCKKQWDTNYSVSSQIVQSLTGFDLNKEIKVYITHPSLKNGVYFGDNAIGWGHHEDFPNYTTVYLWHEILHSYLGYSDLDHSLVQFITDEELRTKLNGGSYPPFVGHEELNPLMEKILPYWKRYIASNKKDIYAFKKELVKRFPTI